MDVKLVYNLSKLWDPVDFKQTQKIEDILATKLIPRQATQNVQRECCGEYVSARYFLRFGNLVTGHDVDWGRTKGKNNVDEEYQVN